MFSKLFGVSTTPRPLTDIEQAWRKFKVGNDIEYLGIKGKIVTVFDLYASNEEDDDHWNGRAHIVMRYLNSIGEFKDIKLYQKDLFSKYSSERERETMGWYISTTEHGYTGPFKTKGEATRKRNLKGYGSIIYFED